MLATNRQAFETDERVGAPALLKGLLFDGAGNRMGPSHAGDIGFRTKSPESALSARNYGEAGPANG